jgi:hypothetical protein
MSIRESQFIELFYGGRNKAEIKHRQIGFNHLCLEVEDIWEIAAHLKAHGIPLDVEPKRGKDNNYQCWVKDPDGNRSEFMQLDPSSPHMNCQIGDCIDKTIGLFSEAMPPARDSQETRERNNKLNMTIVSRYGVSYSNTCPM